MGFGIGPTEILILLVLGVLLFGKNLPNVGRQLGKSLMEFKKGLSDIQSEVNAAAFTDSSSTSRPAQRVRGRRLRRADRAEVRAPHARAHRNRAAATKLLGLVPKPKPRTELTANSGHLKYSILPGAVAPCCPVHSSVG